MEHGGMDRPARSGADRLERLARGLLALALLVAVAWVWAGEGA
ncbi:hypothetical protein [Novilysobacter selenitireducens]|nr:hypothetical protein [Lysobacter selenitireducens]